MRTEADIYRDMRALMSELGALHPTRSFELDGHLVGSIVETLVARQYGLELTPSSNKGYDAIDPEGRTVEIKGTQGNSAVAFRSFDADRAIVVQLTEDGELLEVYNGSMKRIADAVAHRKFGSNGQLRVSLVQLRRLA